MKKYLFRKIQIYPSDKNTYFCILLAKVLSISSSDSDSGSAFVVFATLAVHPKRAWYAAEAVIWTWI